MTAVGITSADGERSCLSALLPLGATAGHALAILHQLAWLCVTGPSTAG